MITPTDKVLRPRKDLNLRQYHCKSLQSLVQYVPSSFLNVDWVAQSV